jgi:hypothetical protein
VLVLDRIYTQHVHSSKITISIISPNSVTYGSIDALHQHLVVCTYSLAHTITMLTVVLYITVDCRTTLEGLDYSGNISITVSGRTCQQWRHQTPHTHPYTEIRDDRLVQEGPK